MINLVGAIEALLFVVGEEGLSDREISRLLEVSLTEVHSNIQALSEHYLESNSGLQIIQTAGRYRIATKAKYENIVKNYAQSDIGKKLTKAQMEVLAIVAYKQPVTRLEIDDIRGVQSSNLLSKLQLNDLIKESGRLDIPGRPIVYETTDYFLDYFGLNALADLPVIDKEEAEERSLFFNSETQQTTLTFEEEND